METQLSLDNWSQSHREDRDAAASLGITVLNIDSLEYAELHRDELGLCVAAQLSCRDTTKDFTVHLRYNAAGQLDIWGDDEDALWAQGGGVEEVMERRGRYPVIRAIRKVVGAAWERQGS